jgi:hypothetical protein
MFRIRNVSVFISKTVGFTPLKPHGSEIRDRGGFYCAYRDTRPNPTQQRQRPQRVVITQLARRRSHDGTPMRFHGLTSNSSTFTAVQRHADEA